LKKNFLAFLSIIFVAFFIFGCSDFIGENQTSQVRFKINIPNLKNINFQEYELSVSLKSIDGKIEKIESKSVKIGTTEEIVFNDILIGSVIKIEANISVEDKTIYHGESDWTEVKLNNNKISIKLEKVENETDEPIEPENPTKIETYYTVNHYKQKIENDEYEFFESQKLKGYVEDYTQAVPLTLEGFKAVPVNQKIITKDTNITVDIYYNRNIVSLSFNTNGGTEISSISGKYGATITSPDNPTKQGYSFEGWNQSLPTTFPSENQSYEATWKPNTYTVIFDANGGTGTIENQIFTYDIPQKLNKNNFTKQNYDFDGWNTESNGSGISYKNEQEVSNLTDINNDEIILYAQWKIQNQVSTVSFSTSETDIDYGTLISLSCDDADAEIYYTTDDSEFSIENWIRYTSEISITENITIRAIAIKTGKINSNITQQTYNLKTYTISFNLEDGTLETDNILVNSGSNFDLSNLLPTKNGYEFVGWKYEDNIVSNLTDIRKNILITATWKPNTYTVIFDTNSGTGTIENQIFTYDIPQKLNKNNFTKQNYDFDGWNTESNGSGISYKNEQEVSNLTDINDDEIILYAQWKIQNQVSTVNFSTSEADIDYGTLISLSCEDADAEIYYTTDDSEFSIENWKLYTSEISITENITIRAIAIKTGKINSNITQQTYNLKTYTISFNLEDGTLETDNILVYSGSNFDLSNLLPTKNGYEFVGWKYEDNIVSNLTDIRKNIVITATWKPITYTVIFDANAPTGVNVEGAMNSQTFNYDESQTLNQNTFTCDLYAFIGWNTVKTPSDSEPGKFYQDKEEVKNLTSENNISITLYAQWEKIQTTVSVTFPTYTDPENLIEKNEQNGNNVIFTASTNYSSYAWFIDGNKYECSTSEFTLDTTDMNGGVYTIMLVVTDSENNMFSAEYQLVITK